MKKITSTFLVFVMALITLSSCLNDNTEYVYYDDTAITNFSLGNLNLYYTTKKKSDGTDSIYKRTASGSSYKFYINQETGEIWNHDSLPMVASTKAILCNITAKNGGTVQLKSLTSDSLKVYNASDSIDFSQPREFYVYNQTLTASKKYTVTVNVHKQKPDSCEWTKVLGSEEQIAKLTDMKAVSYGGKVFLFGNENGESRLYYTANSDGAAWMALTTSPLLDANAWKSTLVFGNEMVTLSNGSILTSTDGAIWNEVATTDIRQLVAASAAHIYAIAADGTLVSSTDKGVTWTQEVLDDDLAKFPTQDLSFVCKPLSTNDKADRIIITGNRSEVDFPSDTTALVWTKIDEYAPGSRSHAWNHIAFGKETRYPAPRAAYLQIAEYNNTVKAMGGQGLGNTKTEALKTIFNTPDGGLTWTPDTVMSVPAALQSAPDRFAFLNDNNGSLWIICGGTGQVWKVRINEVAWKKDQDYFYE